jgi:hypothetical protein
MAQWQKVETTRHQVAVAGRVTDRQTGQAIAGVDVSVKNAGQAIMARGRTAADGHYHVLDLADGIYTVEASLASSGSRYGTAQASATVTRDGAGKINLAAIDLTLPPTTLKGQVTGQGAGALVMAEVRLLGGDERVFTDAEGRYVLSGIETGDRKVAVAARGFQPARPTVRVGPVGAVVTQDFTLVN